MQNERTDNQFSLMTDEEFEKLLAQEQDAPTLSTCDDAEFEKFDACVNALKHKAECNGMTIGAKLQSGADVAQSTLYAGDLHRADDRDMHVEETAGRSGFIGRSTL